MIRHIRRAATPDRQSTRWSRPRDGASPTAASASAISPSLRKAERGKNLFLPSLATKPWRAARSSMDLSFEDRVHRRSRGRQGGRAAACDVQDDGNRRTCAVLPADAHECAAARTSPSLTTLHEQTIMRPRPAPHPFDRLPCPRSHRPRPGDRVRLSRPARSRRPPRAPVALYRR